KHILVTSVIGNSSNENFNMFQSIVSFFCDSKCTPEIVSKMLAHMGVMVSLGTTRNMVINMQIHS
ncbi:hypothetical protein L208DRAFT_1294706, partial [Tricholoma matsutake]